VHYPSTAHFRVAGTAESPGVPEAIRVRLRESVFRDIEQKRRTTRYLHLAAQLVGPVDEI